jgi:DNA-binding LacI/PurR family transcriptional regulator
VERERQVLTALRTRRVDGIMLVVASSGGDVSHIQSAMDSGIPIVCLDRYISEMNLDSVCVDNVAGAHEAVKHLIDVGHRRIGMISGTLHLQISQDRLRGYRMALEEAGIEYDQTLVCDGAFRVDTGYQVAVPLLREQRPTAVFCSNAMIALGLMRALAECRLRCPEDVAVAVFDDSAFSEAVRPKLTCVAQPAYEMGFQATELLLRRIEEPGSQSTNLVLRTELRVRESSIVNGSRNGAGPTLPHD